jgi:hypothetical protein
VRERRQEAAATFALGRRPWRTYFSRSFRLQLPSSRDYGHWSRYVYKVFDEPEEWIERSDSMSDLEWKDEVLGRRRQVKVQIAREAGQVRQIEIEQVVLVDAKPTLRQVLRLDREGSRRLLDLVETLKHVPVEGGETERIDDQTLRDFLAHPDALAQLYKRDPERIRALIETDASAEDVMALSRRRDVVREFRELLADPGAFSKAEAALGRGPETVWQQFIERNPWILGVSLAGQLFTSRDPAKLEQAVVGAAVTGPGKRVDALLETAGRIRSLVFAEIKHHRTALLSPSDYRSGTWAPSRELVGAVSQVQQTVDMAVRAIGAQLRDTDEAGAETGEAVQVVRPRSFLIVGQLDQLRGDGGVHVHKYRSFELFRRNLVEPEILTYDELLARAEWHVTLAEQGGRYLRWHGGGLPEARAADRGARRAAPPRRATATSTAVACSTSAATLAPSRGWRTRFRAARKLNRSDISTACPLDRRSKAGGSS